VRCWAGLILVLIALTACNASAPAVSTRTSSAVASPSPQATLVPPTLLQLDPAQAAPGDTVRVIGNGGYLFTPPSGYNESARNFKIFFDGSAVGELACYVNHCETKIVVPSEATVGAHVISVEGDSRIALLVIARAARYTPRAVPSPQAADAPNTYWVTNPMSDARLYVRVLGPKNAPGKLPALVLVPGGIGTSANFTDKPNRAQVLADAGFVVVVFDPDGRGKSSGVENFGGRAHQDGLAAIIRFVATLEAVDAKKIGLVTYSYGITMASGALARHSTLAVKFLMDWEGPSDRNETTMGCRGVSATGIQWQPCDDEGFWREREAVNYIGRVRVPYQRIQSESDHVQPDNSHAIAMVNAAVQAHLPFVRLNDDTPNQTYDPAAPPVMLPETEDRKLEARIIKYAKELSAR